MTEAVSRFMAVLSVRLTAHIVRNPPVGTTGVRSVERADDCLFNKIEDQHQVPGTCRTRRTDTCPVVPTRVLYLILNIQAALKTTPAP